MAPAPVASLRKPFLAIGLSGTLPPDLLRHIGWAGFSDAVAKVATLATTVIAAASISPAAFGQYVAMYALVIVTASILDAGVSTLVTRETAAGRIDARPAASQALRVRLLMLPCWTIAFGGGALLLGHNGGLAPAAVVAFAATSLAVSGSSVALAGLRGELRFAAAGMSLLAGRGFTSILSLLLLAVLATPSPLTLLGLALLAGEGVTLALSVAAWLFRPRLVRAAAPMKLSLRRSAPFAASSLMMLAYNRLDILLVSVFLSAAGVGAYAMASRIQDALYLGPTVLGAVALPVLAQRWNMRDARNFHRLTVSLLAAGLAISLPVSLLCFLAAPAVINLVFGSQYLVSATPVRILVWFLPFAMIQAPLLAALIARGREVDTTRVIFLTFLTAMTMHLCLDWWAGAAGAAAASLGRDIVAVPAAVLFSLRAADNLPRQDERAFALPEAA